MVIGGAEESMKLVVDVIATFNQLIGFLCVETD